MTRQRALVLLIGIGAVLAVGGYAGPRSGLLVAIGIGFGLTLEGLRFGFAGPWRMAAHNRDMRGLLAQLVAIGLTAAVALPLLAAHPTELSGAHGPIGIAMIGGAFVFGVCMQIVAGCGSGTLVNAGSGNLGGAAALIPFAAGSFLATLHLGWWTDLGSLPVLTVSDVAGQGLALPLTLAGLVVIAVVAVALSERGKRMPPVRLWVAAGLLALLALANLAVAGQPWGVVYGLGLWGAKVAQAGGMDVAATAFWSAPGNAERLAQSVLLDVTSLTNIGILLGAYLVMRWRADVSPQVAQMRPAAWLAIVVAGLMLGYSSRLAFGCNVGAFFSGISTGSLHGWVWFPTAFLGSMLGGWLRPRLLAQAGPAPAVRPA